MAGAGRVLVPSLVIPSKDSTYSYTTRQRYRDALPAEHETRTEGRYLDSWLVGFSRGMFILLQREDIAKTSVNTSMGEAPCDLHACSRNVRPRHLF